MPAEPALYAGFGCQRGCSVQALSALLHDTLHQQGLAVASLKAIASIDLKAAEPGLVALAAQLGLPLLTFDAATLNGVVVQLSQRSASAFAHTGCWGVAESAALVAATCAEGSARLWVERRVAGKATLALAGRG
ncbi:cobalamin biosynthesis protein [Pseudomonas cremoricolorata]|uniref:Cobalamin biosynthesis protein CobE n=1 Tax=Pseudomonas cremoricolorata TaxID=157783 RepID=A0A089WRC2_9PSED|nr:cobalamin biosynthesis protein [Pseudomonas cremoricolorata]AIR91126.1 cobalamin biosynthesis protein CobE [Pseudomonas cremoricolorata]